MNNTALITNKTHIQDLSSGVPKSGNKEGGNFLSGMTSKFWEAGCADYGLDIASGFTEDEHSKRNVLLVEPLSIHQGNFVKNIEFLNSHPAVKICWTEEQEMLRWDGNTFSMFLDAVSHVACSNQYHYNLLSEFIKDVPMSVLRTPIDSGFFAPAEKEPKVVAIGRICYQKNIDGVLELFKNLPDGIEKVYIGSCKMWNESPKPEDLFLQEKISEVADRWIEEASRVDMAKELSTAWGYFNVSIYDVGCLSFLESAMAGCHCFAWDYHPMFDEYASVRRFKTPKEGAKLIAKTLKKVGLKPNKRTRSEIEGLHSHESFRKQLRTLIGSVMMQPEEEQPEDEEVLEDVEPETDDN